MLAKKNLKIVEDRLRLTLVKNTIFFKQALTSIMLKKLDNDKGFKQAAVDATLL